MNDAATLERAEQKGTSPTGSTGELFDPAVMKSGGLGSRITQYFIRRPFGIMAFLRRLLPIATFGNWGIITRYDDVAEALQNDRAIAVPFGEKMKKVAAGPNFVLGMADSDGYQAMHKEIVKAFPHDDNEEIIAPFSYLEAKVLLSEGDGKIDAISQLLAMVPIRICEEYYGLKIADKRNFTRWTITMSSYMFGDPSNNPEMEKAALEAATYVRPIIDEAIDRAQAASGDDTVIARLVQRQKEDPMAMPDNVIRGIMLGMITGFVPTNTMASGHMLELLLSTPDWMRQARHAARDGNDALLQGCLFEAMRFYPINPGPFRVAGQDVVIAAGTRREKLIREGTNLVVSTQSAMHDPRRMDNPKAFDPSRKRNDSMLMGFGLHWCIGAPLAYAQITQTFKALLELDNIRRAPGKHGKMTRFGPFPDSLWVHYTQ